MTTVQEILAARAEMLIRKPVSEVFEAFANPEVTSKFWFTRGTGRLELGRHLLWHWEIYDFSVGVDVLAIEPNKRILVEWSGGNTPTKVEWTFEDRGDGTTFVRTRNWGFDEKDGPVMEQAIGSTEGFTYVLAGAKAWLEHGLQLNLVRDRHPDGL